VGKYVGARDPKNDNKIRRMRFAGWITKGINTHSEYLIILNGNSTPPLNSDIDIISRM
jgi:hypothetical protein